MPGTVCTGPGRLPRTYRNLRRWDVGSRCEKIAHSLSCIERPAFFLSPDDAVHGALGAAQEGERISGASLIYPEQGKSQKGSQNERDACNQHAEFEVVGIGNGPDQPGEDHLRQIGVEIEQRRDAS